tara:strand:- start:136 stop:456 length:321 start_codon:yes stop_codon:yes gene_type:complete
MLKRIIYLTTVFFFVTSCAGTWDSVKRGLTGQKKNSTDEFLVEKKDPLILPPDFENLPTPSNALSKEEESEISSFEKVLGADSLESSEEKSSGNSEQSILEQIRKK